MSRIDDLKAQLAAAKAKAAEKALTDEEKEAADLLAQIEAAREETAAAEAARRMADLKAREAAAEAKAGGKYLVAGVDLVGLFAFGKSPAAEQLPTGGVIVVRSPDREVTDWMNREVEAKKLGLSAILIEVLCRSTVDPDPASADGATLRGWAETYPEAAGQAGQRARELGGAKAAADKRGRT